MNNPGIVNTTTDTTEALRKAIAGLTMLTRENIRLRAELAARDETIVRIRTLLEQQVTR